jgi:hypothetical protein
MKPYRIAVAGLFLVASVISSIASDGAAAAAPSAIPTLRVNASDDLEVIDSKGALVSTISSGNVRQAVSADGQNFMVSYGSDANNNLLIILAPDSTKPVPVSVQYLTTRVDFSPDAIVTLTVKADRKTVRVSSGLVGTVSVNGVAVPVDSMFTPGGSTVGAAGLASTPTTAIEARAVKVSGTVQASAPGVPAFVQMFDGMPVSVGTSIRTGADGSLVLFLGAGMLLQISPNSEIVLEDFDFQQSGDLVSSRRATIKLSQGKLMSSLSKMDPKVTDFKVKTPYGVAAARGTSWVTDISNGGLDVSVNDGAVAVNVTVNGSPATVTVLAGNKVQVTVNGQTTILKPQSKLTAQEAAALKAIVDAAKAALEQAVANGFIQVPGEDKPGKSDDKPTSKNDPIAASNAALELFTELDPVLNPAASTPIKPKQ